MKSKLTKFAIGASIMLAMAFTFSCSSGDDGGGNAELSSSSANSGDKSSSSVVSSSSSVVPSSSSAGVSSSSSMPSSSSIGCTAANNTSTQYCSNGTMKNYGFVTYQGQTYKTVEIGTQTWMAENLNYDVPDNDTDVCYDNDPANCAISGRLYNWATANTVCPSGWHLPTLLEWATLERYISTAATKWKARNGWTWNCGNGRDDYGFSALPGGAGTTYAIPFIGIGGVGYWWSATEYSSGSTHAYFIAINCDVNADHEGKLTQYSVRCVQN